MTKIPGKTLRVRTKATQAPLGAAEPLRRESGRSS